MGDSLQDQLVKAGLVDANKAKQVHKQKSKKARQNRHAGRKSEPGKQPRQKELGEKAARDRELNQRQNEARRQREIAAQVSQLVKEHRHPRNLEEDDRPFYFENKGKIKRKYVSAQAHEMITAGKLVIVNHNGVFELVPRDVAEKIRQRNPSLVIDLPEEKPADRDDPYADFPVPEDLMW